MFVPIFKLFLSLLLFVAVTHSMDAPNLTPYFPKDVEIEFREECYFKALSIVCDPDVKVYLGFDIEAARKNAIEGKYSHLFPRCDSASEATYNLNPDCMFPKEIWKQIGSNISPFKRHRLRSTCKYLYSYDPKDIVVSLLSDYLFHLKVFLASFKEHPSDGGNFLRRYSNCSHATMTSGISLNDPICPISSGYINQLSSLFNSVEPLPSIMTRFNNLKSECLKLGCDWNLVRQFRSPTFSSFLWLDIEEYAQELLRSDVNNQTNNPKYEFVDLTIGDVEDLFRLFEHEERLVIGDGYFFYKCFAYIDELSHSGTEKIFGSELPKGPLICEKFNFLAKYLTILQRYYRCYISPSIGSISVKLGLRSFSSFETLCSTIQERALEILPKSDVDSLFAKKLPPNDKGPFNIIIRLVDIIINPNSVAKEELLSEFLQSEYLGEDGISLEMVLEYLRFSKFCTPSMKI